MEDFINLFIERFNKENKIEKIKPRMRHDVKYTSKENYLYRNATLEYILNNYKLDICLEFGVNKGEL